MPYTQVTRAAFRGLVRNQLGSGGLASSFWRDAELNFIIQESLRFYNLLTGYWKTRAILPTTAATVWYTTPGIITSNMRVTFNGFPMRSASMYSMDFGRSGWESESTTSRRRCPNATEVLRHRRAEQGSHLAGGCSRSQLPRAGWNRRHSDPGQ